MEIESRHVGKLEQRLRNVIIRDIISLQIEKKLKVNLLMLPIIISLNPATLYYVKTNGSFHCMMTIYA